MILNIAIPIAGKIKTNLSLRHIIADTIENRGIGTILSEGTGINYVNITVQLFEDFQNKKQDIIPPWSSS